jgi:hypothetical protein
MDTVIDFIQKDFTEKIQANKSVTVYTAAFPVSTITELAPLVFSGIETVLAFLGKDFTEKIQGNKTVQPPLFTTFPPAGITPQQYTGIYEVNSFLQQPTPLNLTVQPPYVWTYNFTVSDSAHATDALPSSGPSASDTAHATDSLASLTATLTVQDSATATDSLKSLAVSMTVNDLAHAYDSLLTATVPNGQVNISIQANPVNVSVGSSPVGIAISGPIVTIVIGPD